MKLEEYFDFLFPDDIRLKNSPIGIETSIYITILLQKKLLVFTKYFI